MKKMRSIIFMILFVTAMAFSAERAMPNEPICIVHPDVIAACEESGGRFDFRLCSCVGGGGSNQR